MPYIFFIPGTGVPKNIHQDFNYQLFLRAAFNYVYTAAVEYGITKPLIVFAGGPTDMTPPFRRTEAGEMKKVFQALINRPAVKDVTKSWRLRTYEKSISALENALALKSLVTSKNTKLTIMVEFTRRPRWQMFSRWILPKDLKVTILPFDYDVSTNRYLKPEEIKKKNAVNDAFDRWALKNPAHLRQHHAYHAKRLAFLRQAGPAHHVQAVAEWNKRATQELPEAFRKTLPRLPL